MSVTSELDEIGRRIVVMGRGGKTTLSVAIAARQGLPFFDMDAVAFLPDWQPRPGVERTAILDRWLSEHPEGWVLDGDTADSTGTEVTSMADTVIWLDLPFRPVF